jgi:hypothetical protein
MSATAQNNPYPNPKSHSTSKLWPWGRAPYNPFYKVQFEWDKKTLDQMLILARSSTFSGKASKMGFTWSQWVTTGPQCLTIAKKKRGSGVSRGALPQELESRALVRAWKRQWRDTYINHILWEKIILIFLHIYNSLSLNMTKLIILLFYHKI